MSKSKIGVYGLGVMGRNLALNLEENGNRVSVYNRIAPGEEHITDEFLAGDGAKKNFFGAGTVQSFVDSLETPRKILIMVKAGKPVDLVVDELLPYLQKGDIIIDGGNSNFNDTNRRVETLASKGILFVGMGVSGGEEGARFGPSLMPGGNQKAWPVLQPILKPISAEAFDGSPCCEWIGEGGAGHFVKMVHNGIEYADMQLIAETYQFMKNGLDMSAADIAGQFSAWSKTDLSSYLIEITAEIFNVHDDDGTPLVEKILDSAGQKGTGKWTGVTALELGVPLPGITQAVFARFASSYTKLRKQISGILDGPASTISGTQKEILSPLADALLASRMASYAEGFHLIKTAGDEFGWDIDAESVARIWQGGCIIRSELLKVISAAYKENSNLQHLFLSDEFSSKLQSLQNGWRKIIGHAVQHGIPMPNMMAALGLYDSLRSERLPANLVQAQRDFFGAHTYERIDKPRGQFFHTDWKRKQ
jgi:6-phosphogluconate dehydrogenase